MLKIEISNEGNATTQAEGKLIDLVFQSTVAVATIIGMAKESFGEELPHIEDFIILEAQRIAKTKEHEKAKTHTEKKPSEKHSSSSGSFTTPSGWKATTTTPSDVSTST